MKDGEPTKAAEGFCRKNGVSISDIEVEGDYIWAAVHSKGAPAATVLSEVSYGCTSTPARKRTVSVNGLEPPLWVRSELHSRLV